MPPTTQSAITEYTVTTLAVVSTVSLIYLQWQNLPKWMRLSHNLSDQSSRSEDSSEYECVYMEDRSANEHLNSIPALMEKLSQVMGIIYHNTDSNTQRCHITKLGEMDRIASLYSLLHLYTEIETKDPDYRENLYDFHAENDDVELNEVKELVEYLEYAHWAYQKSPVEFNCKRAGLDLISQDNTTEAGRVGHFVACRHSEKLAIIALKGTSTFSDVLTDLIAIPREHKGCYFDEQLFAAPKDGDDSKAEKIWCHEGIFTAAILLADRLESMIENLFVPLNYRVVICGHSLGAGVACLLGLELRSRIPALRKNYTDLRVLAFATPPVLSYSAAKACAPFVTSCVNNSDFICRCSVANWSVMDKLLAKVHDRLMEKGLRVDSWRSLMRYYDEHCIIDDDLLMSEDELAAFFKETHAKPEKETDSLFVPGRVVVLWDKGGNDNYQMGGIVTDGGMKMLRQIELRSTMISDHLIATGYRPNLHKLLDQLENGI